MIGKKKVINKNYRNSKGRAKGVKAKHRLLVATSGHCPRNPEGLGILRITLQVLPADKILDPPLDDPDVRLHKSLASKFPMTTQFPKEKIQLTIPNFNIDIKGILQEWTGVFLRVSMGLVGAGGTDPPLRTGTTKQQ
uniref:Uncharacterized protein n=1 Tax=Oryza nivara TaxID=4536 RepID=A0A0E0FLL4_ORYNI